MTGVLAWFDAQISALDDARPGSLSEALKKQTEKMRADVAEILAAAEERLPSNPANDLQPDLRLRAAVAQASA